MMLRHRNKKKKPIKKDQEIDPKKEVKKRGPNKQAKA